ncbi:hypothetical protein [Mycobacterium sp. JS623]|uniref:hypothetical protein n=1 Tax=Mycobacterium sp. JS623 TaxID=212767 RepID=UPI0002E963AA|nr:hypothetical protein [Mycobacterium sp. JS623]
MSAATPDLLTGVRRLCLALPEVTEGLTHGGETWFVRRRSFAKFVDPQKHRLDERHVAFWAAAPPGARKLRRSSSSPGSTRRRRPARP